MERTGTVAIVGVGLIGGSIGMALRARELAGRVVGVGRDPDRLDEARRLGAIDDVATDLDWASLAPTSWSSARRSIESRSTSSAPPASRPRARW